MGDSAGRKLHGEFFFIRFFFCFFSKLFFLSPFFAHTNYSFFSLFSLLSLFLLSPQFNSPVEVNWDALDTKLLSSFWAASPGRARERAAAAPVSDRILIYRRGVKTVRASGRFIDDKIDLLVDYLLIGPATRAAGAVARAVAKARGGGGSGSGGSSGSANGNGGTNSSSSVDVAMRLQQLASGVSSAPSSNAEAAAAAAEAAGATSEGAARAAKEAEEAAAAEAEKEKIALSHGAAQSVRRVSFRHLMPSALSVLKSLPKVITIEEPAYKDVVVLYRKSVPDKQVRKSEKDPEFDYDPARARRNVHVKRFADVPMADAEMIFPDKTIWLKPILLLQLFATIVGGFVAAWAALKSSSGGGDGKGGNDDDEDPAARAKRSLSVAVAALSLVGGRAAQVYSQAQAARQAVQDAITRRLYDTTMDSQESDVLFLLDEMADQHVKVRKVDFFKTFFFNSFFFPTFLLFLSTGREKKKIHPLLLPFLSLLSLSLFSLSLLYPGALPRLLYAPGQGQAAVQVGARRSDRAVPRAHLRRVGRLCPRKLAALSGQGRFGSRFLLFCFCRCRRRIRSGARRGADARGSEGALGQVGRRHRAPGPRGGGRRGRVRAAHRRGEGLARGRERRRGAAAGRGRRRLQGGGQGPGRPRGGRRDQQRSVGGGQQQQLGEEEKGRAVQEDEQGRLEGERKKERF